MRADPIFDPSSLLSLDGRVAFVTGASRGIGWATAQALAAAGAHVVLAARSLDVLRQRVGDLRKRGHAASSLALDVADETAVVTAVARVAREHGRLDILVNNAGIAAHRRATTEVPTSDWTRVVETNLKACFVLAREAAKPMSDRGWGRVINISSILGLTGRWGTLPYTTSKHGLNGMTRVIAADLGSKGITANAIAPGFVVTEINSRALQDPALRESISRDTLVGRWGEPSDIAHAVLFLASDAASYITGHVLVVDGGTTAALSV